MVKTSMNLEENIASALCYVLFWVTGIIFYILEKNNKIVRFHAMQSILLFLPLQILSMFGFWFLWWLAGLIWLFVFILWLILMLKAYQGEKFKLPIIGDIAEKQA
jgi:uncharacterized membrane protein